LPNRLAREKSPYLLQHADNPVDWRPWGDEALAEARARNIPIFLSIGYATCHWCHVMAHESFEDDEVAGALNRQYVSIKVDREERPDLDLVYMAACQALTGQGGWPLSVFLTPESKPFYAGTYFPKTSRMGRPGFIELIDMLAEKWRSNEDVVRQAADQLTRALQDVGTKPEPERPGVNALRNGYRQLSRSFDHQHGGFGSAPKFPTPHNLNFLLRYHQRTGEAEALEMVEKTLTAMRQGGIYDQIGFGFHRYSVDAKWFAPHFEKMLYDQALLTLAYLEAHQATGDEAYAKTAREVLEYVRRDMTSDEGAFFAAEDADSEGKEGLFYVWRPEEVDEVLGEETGDLYRACCGVVHGGNFEEGLSIPHLTLPLENLAKRKNIEPEALRVRIDQARLKLFDRRTERIRPLKDDKVVTAWNGLMIAAMAKAGQVLGQPEYIRAAAAAADFLLRNLRDPEGRLLRRYREGEAANAGFADDYAFFVWGLIELYEASLEVERLEQALTLNGLMLDLFWDDENGGFYFSGLANEGLVARKKEIYDGALPSANSVAALNMLRLGRMTGRTELEKKADELLKAFGSQLGQYPGVHTHLLMALDFALGPTQEIVVSGDPADERTRRLIREVQSRFLPRKVLLHRPVGAAAERLAAVAPYTAEMKPAAGVPALYFCQGYACRRPETDPDLAAKILTAAAGQAAPVA
jgi:uncharacterized protein YyaL (SSP411 family)